eukprot:16435079-Heterocapsa_arctica.AAC.1
MGSGPALKGPPNYLVQPGRRSATNGSSRDLGSGAGGFGRQDRGNRRRGGRLQDLAGLLGLRHGRRKAGGRQDGKARVQDRSRWHREAEGAGRPALQNMFSHGEKVNSALGKLWNLDWQSLSPGNESARPNLNRLAGRAAGSLSRL